MPLTFKKNTTTTACAAGGSIGNTNGSADECAPASPHRLPRKLLDVKQAADYAGVSESTIRRWFKKNGLRVYRHDHIVRIDPQDIVDFLRSDGQE